jgi:cytoskeletal protein CcmA (bactofilin family)
MEGTKTMAVENACARIGKTVVICGEVKGSEDLIVDGRVEGTISLSDNRLTIGPSANVAADLSAKDVLILGQVQGNVVASGRVELRAGCTVEGDIRALRLAVEDNAVFRGKVDLTQAVACRTVFSLTVRGFQVAETLVRQKAGQRPTRSDARVYRAQGAAPLRWLDGIAQSPPGRAGSLHHRRRLHFSLQHQLFHRPGT